MKLSDLFCELNCCSSSSVGIKYPHMFYFKDINYIQSEHMSFDESDSENCKAISKIVMIDGNEEHYVPKTIRELALLLQNPVIK